MGFFFSSPEDKYPIERRGVSDIELKQAGSRFSSPELSNDQENLIEQALLSKKHEHSGKLSQRDVYKILHHFKLQKKISENDLQQVMKELAERLTE